MRKKECTYIILNVFCCFLQILIKKDKPRNDTLFQCGKKLCNGGGLSFRLGER